MATRQAGVYVRISDDKAADAAGVGRQEADCRDLATRLGWDVVQVYVENDTSAFARKKVLLPDGTTALRVVRPAFRQMLADLAAGAVDAVLAYDLDRVARDPRDLEDLIDVVEARKLPTRAVTGSLDLSNDAGVTMARVMLAVANKSSRDSARRIARKHAELAAAGKSGGGGIRAFGFEPDGRTIREAEADVIRQLADKVLDEGASMKALTTWLDARGVPTVRGGERWNRRSVHTVLTKPKVAGLRVHRGEIVGKAEWPAIVPEDRWRDLVTVLDGRRTGCSNVLVRWLSGVLRCSKCGQGLAGAQDARGGRYWCNPQKGGCGRIAVHLEKTHEAVEGLILRYLARPDVLADLRAENDTRTGDRAREELQADEQQLQELAQLWGRRLITTDEYLTARREIEQRVASWTGVLRAALPAAVRRLTEGDLEATWTLLEPRERQQVAKVVFPSGIRVEPSQGNRFQGFDPNRLVPIDWNGP